MKKLLIGLLFLGLFFTSCSPQMKDNRIENDSSSVLLKKFRFDDNILYNIKVDSIEFIVVENNTRGSLSITKK